MALENQSFSENEQDFREHRECYTNKYVEKSADVLYDSLNGKGNDIVHFPGEKDSEFLLKWLNDNLKHLCKVGKISMKHGLTVYFDDDPGYGGFTICKLNESDYQPGELVSEYGEKGNFGDASHLDGGSEWKLKIDNTRYDIYSNDVFYDSLDGKGNDIVHFLGEKDSKFLLKWLNDNLKQLCKVGKISMKDGLTVYFDDDPSYGGYTICKLNQSYYQPGELESKYGENGNFWDASRFDGRSEWKLKIDDTRYAIYSK